MPQGVPSPNDRCPYGLLAGVRVVELGSIGLGPFCGMVLGDLGADVIRIDRPADAGKASDYPILHRNGRSVALDLKSRAGVEATLRLVRTADCELRAHSGALLR